MRFLFIDIQGCVYSSLFMSGQAIHVDEVMLCENYRMCYDAFSNVGVCMLRLVEKIL